MNRTFTDNVNYIAELDNAYGKASQIYKSNMSLSSTKTYDATSEISIYNIDTAQTSVVLTSAVLDLANIDLYLAQVTSDLVFLYPNAVCTHSYTVTAVTGSISLGTISFTISIPDANLFVVDHTIKILNASTSVYVLGGTISNTLQLLPRIAQLTSANIASFNAVASNIASVTTVATDIDNVNTVALDIANVNAVSANKTNIDIVAVDIANVNMVGTHIANVDTVVAHIANIDTVAADVANIDTVALNIANVNTVATDTLNINAVAADLINIDAAVANAANINTVATNIGNVNTVGTNIANVNSVAADLVNIDAVSADLVNIDVVATDLLNINSVALDLANINTVALNIADVNSFADTYYIGPVAPTIISHPSLSIGDLWYNTTGLILNQYDGVDWTVPYTLAIASEIMTMTNKTLDSITNTIGADHIHYKVRNASGATIPRNTVVTASGTQPGTDYIQVTPITDPQTQIAIGIVHTDLLNNDIGLVINTGVHDNIDTSLWAVGTKLYPNTTGGFTTVMPTSGRYQTCAIVLRQHSSSGTMLVEFTNPIDIASTTQSGQVQLNDTLTSVSTAQALTAAQGKVLQDSTEKSANKGAANGYAPLGADSKVPAANLPSYVDDVIEVATYADLPVTGASGVIYIVVADETSGGNTSSYRWTGTVYAMVSNTLTAADILSMIVTVDGAASGLDADLLDGKHAPTGDIVGTTDSQTLSNKTITGPSFNSITGLATVAPLMDGIAAVGVGTTTAREDHVHPTDTSRQAVLTFDLVPTDASTNPVQSSGIFDALALKAPLASPALTGTPTAPTAAVSTNTTQVATTAFVNEKISNDAVLKTGGTMTGAITALRETKVAMVANEITLAGGNVFTKTITTATTLTVSDWLASGNANSFILELTNGGAFAVTWFAGVKWASGTAPTLTASGVDILGFYSHDGGTTVRGIVLAKDSK